MDLKQFAKSLPGFGLADNVKDYYEPGIGLDPNQRGTTGQKRQVEQANAAYSQGWNDNTVAYTIGGTSYNRAGQPIGQAHETGNLLGAGTGGQTSAWTPQNQQLYDQSIANINAQLARAGRQGETALANIQDVYNQRFGGLESGRKQAQADFDFGSTTNQQNYLTDSNRINSQAAQGLRGLLRQLGAMGAGGGSAYQFAAPEAVGEFAREQLGGAGQGYAGNARELDRSLTTFMNDADTQEKQLGDWRTQQRQQAQSTVEQSKASLLDSLRQLAAERTQAMGGNIQAALDPITGKIRQAESRIDELQRFRPEFSGETPVYTTPELSRFQMANTPNAQFTPNAQSGPRSYLNLLLGRDEERLV